MGLPQEGAVTHPPTLPPYPARPPTPEEEEEGSMGLHPRAVGGWEEREEEEGILTLLFLLAIHPPTHPPTPLKAG